MIDIREICPEWDAIHEAEGSPTSDQREYVWALDQVSAAIREEYGIDVH